MKNGKGEVDASALAILAHVLKNLFGYFYPPFLYREIKQEELTPFENELLLQFRQIYDDILRELVVKQVKVMAEFDTQELVIELAPDIAETFDWEDEIIDSLKRRSKRSK
ncbi:hypothetical protein KQH50_03255 [bacterium]|nr:hypothetical protein [bacterium]